MAKIRTVKPELFRHEELYEIEKNYQLPIRISFVGLFTCCDREGRFRWRPKQLKLDVLPYDDIRMEDVLSALLNNGFIVQYSVDGEVYGYIPSWNKHQYINNRESASVLPEPPLRESRESEVFSESGLNGSEPRSSSVLDASQPRLDLLEGKGNGKEEEKGMELEIELEHEKIELCKNFSKDILAVFNFWKVALQHPQAVLDKKREQVIYQALQSGYSVDQLCEAITGCSKTPHNMGDNERNQRYDGIHLILRDADQIERFIRNSHQPPFSSQKKDRLLQANLTAGKNWLTRKLAEVKRNDTHGHD
jgi:hypothetical protein